MEMLELVPNADAGRVYEAEDHARGSRTSSAAAGPGLDAIARWLQEVARQDLEERRLCGPRRLDRASDPNPGRGLPPLRGAGGAADLLQRPRPLLGRAANERRERRGARRGRQPLDLHGARRLAPQRLEGEFRDAYAPSAGEPRRQRPYPPSRASARRRRAALGPSAPPTSTSPATSTTRTTGRRLSRSSLTEGEPEAFDGEVEHREPAQPGPAVLLSAGPMRWVASPSGALHASIHRA